MIQKERDKNIKILETNIFSKMNEILGPEIDTGPKNNLKFVSVEDAIKELIEIENKINVVPTLTSLQ
jgi:hypothetical protein